MSVFFVGRGTAHLGRVERDAKGNETKRINAHWEPDQQGGSVAMARIDPETMEPVEPAAVFGDWDAAGYLAKVMELLGPGRHTNLPDIKGIFLRAMVTDGWDPCEYCNSEGHPCCQDCIITTWREEAENE